jgi:hypothetical protein
MEMKTILLLSVTIFFISIPAYGLNFENTHTYRYDIRGSDGGDMYLVKATLKDSISIEQIKRDLSLGVFIEGQYAFDPDKFDFNKVGGLAGLKILKWLSVTEDIYYSDKSKDTTWRSKLTASFPFEIFNSKPSLKIFEEFRFNLDEGEGNRNDVGVGIDVPLTDIFSCYLGWRHADRIHSYDTDYVETKLTLSF